MRGTGGVASCEALRMKPRTASRGASERSWDFRPQITSLARAGRSAGLGNAGAAGGDVLAQAGVADVGLLGARGVLIGNGIHHDVVGDAVRGMLHGLSPCVMDTLRIEN